MKATLMESAGHLVDEPRNADRTLVFVLRLSALMCFAGWTWVHLYWEGPYGILLWHDSTYELANRFGISWDEFVGTGNDDGWLQKWIARIGWLYLACTVFTLTVRAKSYLQMAALIGGAGLLTILSYAKYVSSQYQLPMFVEHGGQMLSPILLVIALALGARHRITVGTAILAVVMTFAGHGSYALGWWPTPGTFYGMICVSLGVEYETAHTMLRCFGVLDFAVCIAMFIPALRRPAAMYAVVWGFLTAVARPVAGMSWGLNYWGADQFLHEAVLRAPHFLIPLYLVILWGRQPAAKPISQPADIGSDHDSISITESSSTVTA
ncbi:hypothetical protein [Allorhodopirellula heiligendammensis]|uniref:Transmembrane protein n=1 Tax=Allorhodopirellula heiligendammensis TaxID=2714739 RepID=A0A5C6BU51_9BACT|nr:hypothetical protein [Allorhodopirellula heiligendammensis]TWU15217.1 hypothetical protein Poly21_24110 [Allorhodopirellula heiligendammensis]